MLSFLTYFFNSKLEVNILPLLILCPTCPVSPVCWINVLCFWMLIAGIVPYSKSYESFSRFQVVFSFFEERFWCSFFFFPCKVFFNGVTHLATLS